MSENNAMTEGAASEEAITAEKNQLAECWAHVVRITLGWMNDINDRMPSIAWGATAPHRGFIDFIENMSEKTTFEEYKRQAQLLMQMHAQARNDIYDGVTCETKLDDDGKVKLDDDGKVSGVKRIVSREQRDVIALCEIWWKNQ
jgi:hypothetical protein